MLIFQAIILGIIEGLTEFLPISSTGHLILAEKYMSFRDDAKIFTVVIQIGAVVAVAWYFRKDLIQKFSRLFAGKEDAKKLLINIFIALLPAGLLGLALDKSFEKYAKPTVVAIALIAGGVILWLVDRKSESHKSKLEEVDLNNISPKQAFGVGIAQCFALIPGVSRSGASIVGGLLGGLNRVSSTTFSFYVGIPLLLVASGYKLVKHRHDLASVSGGSASIIAGTIASFIVGLIAVSWLIKYISSHNFKIFAYYRIGLGIIVLILLR